MARRERQSPLAAAIEWGNNVLQYGGDTFGLTPTPLFTDGLNVDTRNPPDAIPAPGAGPEEA
ncbi:MAG TPA: hypothetical protein VM492_02490 [Sumerlaeia bacterium]|nr:hypothetical protein [Sumerlaeia bacterium]